MLITKVETIPIRHYLFVKVHTDEGITGLGEAGNWGFIDATASAIKKMSEFIIGHDPAAIEHHYQNLYRAMYFRGSVIMSAISAIDIALWDIKGKKLGVPIYDLLGGKTRNRVRTYASGFTAQTADQMASACVKLKHLGFSAVKLFLSEPASTPDGEREFNKVDIAVEKVRACRQAVGNDFDLILELHRSLSAAEALTFCRAVEPFRPFAVEDPITPDNPDMMGWLAGKVNVPIATGERFITLGEFQTLLSRNGALYVRPDVCAIGGFTAAKKVAAIAESHNVQIIPHNPLGPISTAACLHLCASIPNLGIQELPDFCLDGREDAMVDRPLKVENGCLLLPDAPGLGIELMPDADKIFPAKDRASKGAKLSFDGSVLDS